MECGRFFCNITVIHKFHFSNEKIIIKVSGAHGYSPVAADAVEKMSYFASKHNKILNQSPPSQNAIDEGFTTFDLADIYGPAEDYVGAFRRGRLASSISQQCQYLTKWVPRPAEINRRIASEAIGRSLDRMKTDRLDLLQFHWYCIHTRTFGYLGYSLI